MINKPSSQLELLITNKQKAKVKQPGSWLCSVTEIILL